MNFKQVDIAVIGAMDKEVESLISALSDKEKHTLGSITFYTGTLSGKRVAVARCGIGKVFAAMCAEALIIALSPRLVINTGVGGALASGLTTGNIVAADRLVQHDMDTSPLGDPRGLVSGINKIYFEADAKALTVLTQGAKELGLTLSVGTVASGDRFIASPTDKADIVSAFCASVCEMEGAAIAQTCFVNNTPFAVIRAISDSADGGATMDYMEFLPIAAENSANLTKYLIENYKF